MRESGFYWVNNEIGSEIAYAEYLGKEPFSKKQQYMKQHSSGFKSFILVALISLLATIFLSYHSVIVLFVIVLPAVVMIVL